MTGHAQPLPGGFLFRTGGLKDIGSLLAAFEFEGQQFSKKENDHV